MKKLFAILLVTILTSCGAALEPPKSNTDYKNIIGKPIKIGNIEVAQYDFPYDMELNDAKKACEFGDDGWRLPSEDELNYLYENRASVGGFEGDVYWHSKVDDSRLWLRYFNNATMNGVFKVTSGYVRAVRALKQSAAMRASEQLAALKKPKSNTDYEKIIGKPIKIRNIEVTQYDFPEQMKWENAKKACAALGDGWRLPSLDELNILYTYQKRISGFADNYYWSSSELDNNYAWYQYFNDGRQGDFDKIKKIYVRAIRAPEQSAGSPKSNTDYKNIIGKPIKIGNIEVAQYDFPEEMNSEDAKKACADLGEGWKLPSQDELNDLYQNKVAIGGFVDDGYWSSTEGGSHGAWAQDFASGNKYSSYKNSNLYKFYVRAIRAF
jgi:hypothetical protein